MFAGSVSTPSVPMSKVSLHQPALPSILPHKKASPLMSARPEQRESQVLGDLCRVDYYHACYLPGWYPVGMLCHCGYYNGVVSLQ